MRSFHSVLLASLLALSPLACKPSGGSAKAPVTDSTTARPPGPKMPRPYSLPAKPEAVVHVDAPKQLLAEILSYSPGSMTPRQAIAQALRSSGQSFETQLSPHVGLHRSWNMAIVEGQTIVHVPLHKKGVAQVAAVLSKLPPEGDFGAVRIPRQGQDGPKLAFLDRHNDMLTLADDLRGIATGPELGRAYGKQEVNIAVDARQAARYGARLGAERATVTGSMNDLRIEIEGTSPLPPGLPVSEGALTGLLESKQIALGGSTKYTDYKGQVDAILSQGRRQVSSLPSIAQGNGKELLNRATGMLRSWNGRSMVGVGPANHLQLGLGSDDPQQMGSATLYFVRGVLSNIKTVKSLRSFGVKIDVPTVRFTANAAKVGNESIHLVVLENARKYVPAEVHPLLSEDNKLQIAMAFPKRAGAGMFVVGRKSNAVLANWLRDTQKATPGAKTTGHLASATVAVGAKALQTVMQAGFDPFSVLGFTANRPPTRVVVQRTGQSYVIRLKRAGKS